MTYKLPKPAYPLGRGDLPSFSDEQVVAAYAAGLADASPNWLPIESAPKDGTHIFLTNGNEVSQGKWLHLDPYSREIRDTDGRYIDQDEREGYDGWVDFVGGMSPDPTHYMPLPAAPEPKP